MSGRFVIQWTRTKTRDQFLRTLRRFSVEKNKVVLCVSWESLAENATQFGSAEAAMNEWNRLGYASADYVSVFEL